MRLVLNNINKIKKADIELNGLTVIAGVNDSGKSTVGRVLFSVTKALINGLNNDNNDKVKIIKERFSSLYKRLSSIRTIDRELLWKYFSPLETPRKLESLLSSVDFDATFVQNEILKIVHERLSLIESLDITPRHKSLALKDLLAVKSILTGSDDYSSRFRSEFQNQIESEFFYNICSVDTDYSEIQFHSDSGLAEVRMKDNEIVDGRLDEDFDYSLSDVTFVETPLYLHLMDALYRASTYKELENKRATLGMSFGMVSVHIKDLMTKLDYSKYMQRHSLFSNTDNSFNIESIIGGHFVYDKKSKNLLLVKREHGKEVAYSPVNVASGAKSFGLVQLLLDMDFVNESKMLIWDEPENHLHPEWQIEFAHLLVKLAKSGIPVVVSSHSPYFIQGIRYFSKEEKMDNYVNYYLAEENKANGLCTLHSVTNDLNQVFVKLAEPLNRIMNLNK